MSSVAPGKAARYAWDTCEPQACRWAVGKCCGKSGEKKLASCVDWCDRPNPIMQAGGFSFGALSELKLTFSTSPGFQISYVCLIGIGLYLYWTNLFVLIPNPRVPGWHV